MASGIISSVSFVPKAAGKLIVTCIYDITNGAGFDWGSNIESRIFMTQSGVSSFSSNYYSGTVRQRVTNQYTFIVAGGSTVQCGLFGNVVGATGASWQNIVVNATLLKK